MKTSTLQSQGITKVIIKPISATFTKTDDIKNPSNIYCKISVAGLELKTSGSTNSGKQLTWTDALEYPLDDEDSQVHIELYSKDSWQDDDAICDTWIPIFDTQEDRRTCSLLRKGDEIGIICIVVEYSN